MRFCRSLYHLKNRMMPGSIFEVHVFEYRTSLLKVQWNYGCRILGPHTHVATFYAPKRKSIDRRESTVAEIYLLICVGGMLGM